MDDIMVSVCCLVYNHEKYLRKCLDGFIMQKTNFKFEILIHDDASTDGSANIIREYENKFPDIIKPIYQTENQHSKGVRISWNLQYPRAKGKYIALCEGDDYWTDEHKLQKQFDALEQHEDCVFCAHKVECINENGTPTNSVIPGFSVDGKLNSSQWAKLLIIKPYVFQTSSYFFRQEAISKFFHNLPDFVVKSPVGDTPLMLLLSTEGNCIYIPDGMSCYRVNSIGSWTKDWKKGNGKNFSIIHQKNIDTMTAFDEYTGHIYSENIKDGLLGAEMSYYASQKNFKKCLEKKYRPAFKRLSLKVKIYYYMFGLFPWLHPLYTNIIRIKHE